jgi:hypothetical protein
MSSFRPIEVKRAACALAAAMAALALPQAHAAGVSGQGTWETTLQARDLDGNLSNGPEAFFDAVLNVTWLADANAAKTSGYDADGLMSWEAAKSWAQSLNIDGVTGWHLPGFNTGEVQCQSSGDIRFDGSACGWNAPTGASLAHLFYDVLGNKATFDLAGNPQSNSGLTNTGPFKQIQVGGYWYEQAYHLDLDDYRNADGSFNEQAYLHSAPPFGFSKAWIFSFTDGGIQAAQGVGSGLSAWAVHDGDVGSRAPVPEPEGVALALGGLTCLVALRNRRGLSLCQNSSKREE